ncbi:MAG: R3H domain-containing nucleic acid-binding protein [Jaaginema sp. PMC 1079.18]|nr:R3H domain-containing nucleic acid-binding protein [Jaaginema sp. PMC 1080.18]MEC4853666.1 R3H domain-containing nucleic acid-binding protein [Jaaginema sp. PMC 1079.18]MEC4869011.1 R3H domain-containing nucleic acid-binding protein [Jaaginema sp. PMC 1078.18]
MSDRVQRAQQWLEQLLQLMQYPTQVTPLDSNESVGQSAWLAIESDNFSAEQIQNLIGEEGRTIDALQYLVNAIVNLGLPPESQQPFTLELDGYRQERQAALRSRVAEVAQTVQNTGETVEMEPMSSAERRQVHNLFREYPDLQTESRGAEPNRRLWVSLKAASVTETED